MPVNPSAPSSVDPEPEIYKKFLSPSPATLVVVAESEYVNVAPCTWIQKISATPPIMVMSWKVGSDTPCLLRVGKKFVVSQPARGFEEDVLLCAKRIPYGESELKIPGVRFKVVSRDGDLVFLSNMVFHASCEVFRSEIMGERNVFFMNVLDLRMEPEGEKEFPGNVMLHFKTKQFVTDTKVREFKGW